MSGFPAAPLLEKVSSKDVLRAIDSRPFFLISAKAFSADATSDILAPTNFSMAISLTAALSRSLRLLLSLFFSRRLATALDLSPRTPNASDNFIISGTKSDISIVPLLIMSGLNGSGDPPAANLCIPTAPPLLNP